MQAYSGLTPYYGDLHSHCDISYGHGTLEEAFLNARQQLDFCSVTGHALWPDMPQPDDSIRYIIGFHEEGFARLRERWPEVQRTTEAHHQDGEFVTFLSFEMHSCTDGDYTVLYQGSWGNILEVESVAELHDRLRTLKSNGIVVIAFPHHIAYRRGQRGINWAAFEESLSPVVEIVSMHGCSEADEGPRPFLHVMGPSDHGGTMQSGLSQGHFFGVIGSTDHHSGHPGSYGHGRTGLWARAKTRSAIWEALLARRTYALTGDRIALQFAINDHPIGTRITYAKKRQIAFCVVGGAPIDYVDVVKNGSSVRRFSRGDVARTSSSSTIRTKLYLEVGWGERGVRADWDVLFGISEGRVLAVEPRFRGSEVVAPTDEGRLAPFDRVKAALSGYGRSRWEPDGRRAVRFWTATFGNPNNMTPATQGICLDVEMPIEAEVKSLINGRRIDIPLARLLAGARAGRLGQIASAAYRFHRAPRRWEFDWRGQFEEVVQEAGAGDVYYLRVRQMNDQWAWSSPIQVGAV
ncbi:MAG: DUF3604 domain-containing protein [Anaerolineae bacterium]|jgi:hypothetical protein